MLYDQVRIEKSNLSFQKTAVQKMLLRLPPGEINCVRNGKYIKWVQKSHGKCSYIRKKNRSYAEQLAQSRYLSLLLRDLQKEDALLSEYLTFCEQQRLSDALLKKDGFGELLDGFNAHFKHSNARKNNNHNPHTTTPSNEALQAWMDETYQTNKSHPEHLRHRTVNGLFVRSKSEALIANCLFQHDIPYRYEAELILDGYHFYPDFTIMHPQSGNLFYWEHFGLMDNPEYRNRTFHKLQLFADNGIFPDIQLITTYETFEHPLNILQIENVITTHFIDNIFS